MSTSQFSIRQRQQEQQRVKKLLWLGLTTSIVLHGILALTLPRQLATKPPQVKKPMKLILVDKPKPKPKPKETQIAPKPKPEPPQQKAPEPPKPPEPKPEPPQQKTPEPKPEPPKPKLPEPKPEKAPAPKKILTSNQPPVPKAAVAPKPQRAIAPPVNDSPPAKETPSPVATNSPAPSIPEPESTESENDGGGISCVSNCEPEYPGVLNGAEGNASVRLTIDNDGNVIGVAIASPDNNMDVNRQALLAARQMQFSSPGDQEATVVVNINFTVEGSEFDRIAKERQEQQEKERQAKLEAEREAKERQQQEAARQQQLEQERQEAVRQQQLKQPATTQPQPQIPDAQTAPKPLPTPLETEANDEMLRKFRERIEQRQ
jgi:periplasmic protein TonB